MTIHIGKFYIATSMKLYIYYLCLLRVWCVRFNPFHDQLLLTASSDARVLLSSAASVSSEYGNDLNITEEADAKQV